jgi:acetyl-CoA synthetase
MQNKTTTPYSASPLNITYECLIKHAQGPLANNTAMVFVDDHLVAKEFTYRQLDDLSARFAASLRARGMEKGDRVLLRLPNTYLFPVAFFGAIRGGYIPVPSSPMLKASELEYLLSDSGAQALVSDDSLMQEILPDLDLKHLKAVYIRSEKAAGDFVEIEDELKSVLPDAKVAETLGADPAYLVYTSGTTGFPKGVLHAQQALMGRLPAATHWFSFSGNDRIMHTGKFNWTYVLGTALMDPLYQGKTVVVYDGQNSPERWIQLIREHECNIFIAVPTIFRQILQKTAFTRQDVPTLTHAMCAGEHLTHEVLSSWIERFQFPIYEGLGMSECSYYISQSATDPARENSAGKIQPGHYVALLDEDLQPVPAGSEGMLCINRNDPGLFLSYWKNPEATQQQFRDGWFLTGDYATQDADGYIYFLGRRDEIIKSFGYRVSPFEIERVFRDLQGIEDVVAFAENLGPEKTLIAMCILAKAGKAMDPEAVLEWGRHRLADYKLPKKIYFLNSFPRSANGKVLRSRIKLELGIDKG